MTRDEIENEMWRLRCLLRDIEKEETSAFKEKAKQNVGRCFVIDGRMCKVIDIPQEEYDKTGHMHFNRYQYPALYLGYEEDLPSVVPFYYDTVFSGIWGDGCRLFNKDVREISKEEFAAEFKNRLTEFESRYI